MEAVEVYLADSIETTAPRVCYVSQKNGYLSRLVFSRTTTAMLFISTTSGVLTTMTEMALEHGDGQFWTIAALPCIVEGRRT